MKIYKLRNYFGYATTSIFRVVSHNRNPTSESRNSTSESRNSTSKVEILPRLNFYFLSYSGVSVFVP